MPDTIIGTFLFSYFSVLLFFPTAKIIFITLLKKWQFPKCSNYRSEIVRTGLGLLFALNHLLLLLIMFSYEIFRDFNIGRHNSISDILFFFELDLLLFGLPLFVAFIGYCDDVRGQREKGLTKNIKKLLNTGRPTSSLLKLFVIVVCAFLWASQYEFMMLPKNDSSVANAVVNIILIALLTNFFNLLDLRPARAIKNSILMFVPLSCFDVNARNFFITFLLAPTFASVLAYAPLDFRGQAMMGDAGSNMLGFVLGIGYAVILPLPAKVAVVILLTLFHIYCEFYSFSDFISRHKILRWLDEWGTCMRKDSRKE